MRASKKLFDTVAIIVFVVVFSFLVVLVNLYEAGCDFITMVTMDVGQMWSDTYAFIRETWEE